MRIKSILNSGINKNGCCFDCNPYVTGVIDVVRNQGRVKKNTHSHIFKKVAANASLRCCQDQAFVGLRRELQVWLPQEWV